MRLVIISLAAVVVGLMAVGYSFILRGVATAPDATLGTFEVPGPGDLVATGSLDDGTPVFVVSEGRTVHVLDARAPVREGTVPTLVAWCDAIDAFETGPIGEGDLVRPLGFEADGTAFGPVESTGLTRYATRRANDQLIVLDSSTPAGGRINGLPDCPAGSDRVMHRPAPGEVFDPSVAIESEPPGVVWLEGSLRAVGNQALLCDGTHASSESCESGAVARGIDPATIAPEGVAGFFVGVVRDGGIVGLAHALVLTEAEGS